MTAILPASKSSVVLPAPEDELVHLERYVSAVAADGLRCNRLALVHFFVTLKTHTSVLIVGPENTGKIALVRAFNRTLGGESLNHLQLMVGHARWASGARNMTQFVELQSRFNDLQILSGIEEAGRAENRRQLFISCLTRISPLEIYRYFSSTGFQFWPWMIQQRGSDGERRSLPFPSNFRLIGTMNTNSFQWWDSDLLKNTSILLWPGHVAEPASQPVQSTLSYTGDSFLDACVWETSAAYRKLKRLLRGINTPFAPLLHMSETLRANGVQLPSLAMNQTVRYLANAWSKEDLGLFDTSHATNLRIGLDMAVLQYVLPWAVISTQPSPELRQDLTRLLDIRFPQASAFVQTWR